MRAILLLPAAAALALTSCGVTLSNVTTTASRVAKEVGAGVGASRDEGATTIGVKFQHDSAIGRVLRLPWLGRIDPAAEELRFIREQLGRELLEHEEALARGSLSK